MTTSPHPPSTHLPAASSTYSGPLRLLSHLRAYTHAHLSSGSPSSSHHRSYRNSWSRAVGRVLSDTALDSSDNRLQATVSTQSAPEDRAWSTAQPSTRVDGAPEPSSRSRSSTGSSSSPSTNPSGSISPSNSLDSSVSAPSTGSDSASEHRDMARTRIPASTGERGARTQASNGTANQQPDTTPSTSREPGIAADKSQGQPTIRLFAYQDPNQSTRPSLPFTTITRTLPRENAVIRVGRYSERDGIPTPNPPQPSEAPVGFKSKVVSRKHCEFTYTNNQWHIKDVGSSSGTFLNHMRLSPPSAPSRLYAIRDGDIIQLGVDFKGGEEMIFRCVRIRIECNRAWQRQPNEFNKNTANLINNLGRGQNADYTGCRECSICLGSVLRPYQCLFMAACAHVWHYKCIRRLIHTPEYPMFQCPNCRAYTDLSADVDDTNDSFENDAPPVPTGTGGDQPQPALEVTSEPRPAPPQRQSTTNTVVMTSEGLAAAVSGMELSDPPSGGEAVVAVSERTPNMDIPGPRQPQPVVEGDGGSIRNDTESPGIGDTFEDCPLTPRNDLGLLALDGRAGHQ